MQIACCVMQREIEKRRLRRGRRNNVSNARARRLVYNCAKITYTSNATPYIEIWKNKIGSSADRTLRDGRRANSRF
jgi:hypothetical protein